MQSLVVNVTSDISTPPTAGYQKSPSRKSRKLPQHATSGTFATIVDNIIPLGHTHVGMSPNESLMTGMVENSIVSPPANRRSPSKRSCSLLRSVLVGNMNIDRGCDDDEPTPASLITTRSLLLIPLTDVCIPSPGITNIPLMSSIFSPPPLQLSIPEETLAIASLSTCRVVTSNAFQLMSSTFKSTQPKMLSLSIDSVTQSTEIGLKSPRTPAAASSRAYSPTCQSLYPQYGLNAKGSQYELSVMNDTEMCVDGEDNTGMMRQSTLELPRTSSRMHTSGAGTPVNIATAARTPRSVTPISTTVTPMLLPVSTVILQYSAIPAIEITPPALLPKLRVNALIANVPRLSSEKVLLTPSVKTTPEPGQAQLLPVIPIKIAAVVVAGGRYLLGRKLGSGAYGDVFHGYNCALKQECAIKRELFKAPIPLLAREYHIYTAINNYGTGKAPRGVPRALHYCREGEFNLLMLDLLGPSLEDRFNQCGRRFSLRTVLLLAAQMLMRLESMHTHDYLHRDLKPENFLMGHSGVDAATVYLIDFGLAKRYRSSSAHVHVAYAEGLDLTGTARYASLNSHAGCEQSRRDDLESLGFVLLYFTHRGHLPWQNLRQPKDKNVPKFSIVEQKKRSFSVESLCEGLPDAFATYINYCRALSYTDLPDYVYLQRLFSEAYTNLHFPMEVLFDWDELPRVPRLMFLELHIIPNTPTKFCLGDGSQDDAPVLIRTPATVAMRSRASSQHIITVHPPKGSPVTLNAIGTPVRSTGISSKNTSVNAVPNTTPSPKHSQELNKVHPVNDIQSSKRPQLSQDPPIRMESVNVQLSVPLPKHVNEGVIFQWFSVALSRPQPQPASTTSCCICS